MLAINPLTGQAIPRGYKTPGVIPMLAPSPFTAFCDTPPTGIPVGYARVSTDDQRLDLQRDALTRYGVEAGRIYEEHVSGVKTARPVLAECLRALRAGDVLVVWKLDRLGRSLRELIDMERGLKDRGVGFHSLTEMIDTTTAVGKFMFHVFGAVAEFERNLVVDRTKAGLAAARARGHRGGRKAKLDATKLKAIKAMLGDPTVTMPEVAKLFGCCEATIYRAFAKERQEASALKPSPAMPPIRLADRPGAEI
jgi:DNA invertase Pin-like site-specific DNA recombinase